LPPRTWACSRSTINLAGLAVESRAGDLAQVFRASLIEGEGKRMRHVKLRPGKELDDEALSELIAAACQDIGRRLNPLGGSAEGVIH
jgi:hypothetical protein